jgi:rhamnose transport system ATP-binding protein
LSDLLLEAARVTKTFAGVHALRGVSFELRAGEVHALVGENGAGKSTLIRIITGAETADSGALSVAGRAVPHMDPATARSLGIAAIYQHPALFPDLTVSENIALSLGGSGALRRIDWKARRRMAAQLLEQVGAAIDPDRLVDTLSMPERQLVEIAKAIGASGRILIMDEPTASLTERELESLLHVVRRVRAHGAGVIYISHKVEEVFSVADRITVLRDGESIATRRRDDIDRDELVRLMVGRELAAVYPKRAIPLGAVALELRDVSNSARGVRQISLTVRRGEILGIGGLVGSGRTELAETIFGLTPCDAGDILVNGSAVTIDGPADAMRLGIGYVPEDRQRHGVIADMSIAANITLNNLGAVSTRGLINVEAERCAAARYADQLRIKTPSVEAAVGGLSGGNQQKVALARWLSMDPAVLILDEPTQGIDIGAKAEIHEIMERLAEQGVAIVMISSELPELLAMADRVAVMRRGRLAGILGRDEATPQTVMAMALGHAA